MEQQGINPPFIVTDGLTKTYIRREKPENGGITRLWRRETREVQALRDVSFRIGRGELVGLIGPNGAGKSTLVKLMTGILTPTSGSCTVDGRTPWAERKAHVRSLGAVFGQRMQLWWDVPIRDSFDLLRDIYSIDEGRYRRRLDELTTALDLGDIMQSPLRQLSLGQRMRAELCGSLLHEPALLFLDEPTIGLDAVSKLKLREFLRVENETRRTTILLTTHDMEDMRQLIFSLKEATGYAKPVAVKVAAVHNVAAIASGMARAGADIIVLDGFRGGTGAAPKRIRDNVGIPIELALAAVDERLRQEGIRSTVSLVASGTLRNAADVVRAVALGADAVSIGSAALIAMGCHQCGDCASGRCNWGIATQRADLVARLNPDAAAERVVNLVSGWNREIQEMMGGMGINAIDSLRGNRLMLRGVGLNEKELEILGVKYAGE